MRCTDYPEVWVVDTEFARPPGMPHTPVCLVGRELKSGARLSLWHHELAQLHTAPFDAHALVVFYNASADMGTFVALGWQPPRHVIDLFVEFRRISNGLHLPHGDRLVGACLGFGVQLINATAKDVLRSVVVRGGPWSCSERQMILEYCDAKVLATMALLERMETGIDLPRALLRGRYMIAVAEMEQRGIPVDVDVHDELMRAWPRVKRKLIDRYDDLGVFDGTSFNATRFCDLVVASSVSWPCSPAGVPRLDDDTMSEMAELHGWIGGVHRVRRALAQMQTIDLQIGADRRARAQLYPFRAKTSRNQPSTSHFLLGLSRWLRGLVVPQPGRAIAYVDWSQQELGNRRRVVRGSCDDARVHVW